MHPLGYRTAASDCLCLLGSGLSFAGRADEAAHVGDRVEQTLFAKGAYGLACGVTGDAELLDEGEFGDQVLGRIGA